MGDELSIIRLFSFSSLLIILPFVFGILLDFRFRHTGLVASWNCFCELHELLDFRITPLMDYKKDYYQKDILVSYTKKCIVK